ncbi:MAG: hypothetical protein QNJ70_01610 [Xenococcaceae cyanobacterium MO_207.B15]|nr:hypothetical protein [Xenococcaceae cyanobacterium MO_207.B15]
MDKEELIKRAKDPKYIPGIYNYCDRWCERCQFTSRCLNHSLEEDQNCQLEEIDEANERFWYSIKDSFELAFSLIEDLAKEEGVDLESIEIDEDDEIDNKVDILTHRSMNYANLVDEWFKNNQNIIDNELAPLTTQLWGENISKSPKKQSHLKLIHLHTTEIPISLKEVIEVINYYQYAITVKLSRAIKSRDNEEKIGLEDIVKDSDGSAKIALIEIERSIHAWSELLKYFEAEPRDILKIINYLKQIREFAEKEFPNARSFIRPGFDEVAQNG